MGDRSPCERRNQDDEQYDHGQARLIYRRSWPTRHDLEMEVFSYLEGFYNTRRWHSRLGNLSPPTTRTSS